VPWARGRCERVTIWMRQFGAPLTPPSREELSCSTSGRTHDESPTSIPAVESTSSQFAGRTGRIWARGNVGSEPESVLSDGTAGVMASRSAAARPERKVKYDSIEIDTDEMLRLVGAKIRRVRQERQLTLEVVANRTGLTGAMVSMVELGRVAPSIGTLVAIASALDIHMSDLFDIPAGDVGEPVTTQNKQPTFETAEGVLRRLVQVDGSRGLEFAINEYRQGTSNAATAVRHRGREYGLLLEGRLTVELGDSSHDLRPGDSITYSSMTPHRIINTGRGIARAVWVKLDSDGPADAARVWSAK